VHGIGGIVGALLTGVFATTSVNALSEARPCGNRPLGLGGAIVWSAVGTFAVLMICKFTTGLRVTKDEEVEGLDYTQHGEAIH
jgi:ammonium transporter, Amt family